MTTRPIILPPGLIALTQDEIDQLANIDTTTISITQWGYLGVLDQSLTTASNVSFNSITGLTNLEQTSGSAELNIDTLIVGDKTGYVLSEYDCIIDPGRKTSTYAGMALYCSTNTPAGGSWRSLDVACICTLTGGGVSSIVSTVSIDRPSIVKLGGSTVTNASTVHITGVATGGINNYTVLDSSNGTIQSNSVLKITKDTDATSAVTGSVIMSGGVGIKKQIHCDSSIHSTLPYGTYMYVSATYTSGANLSTTPVRLAVQLGEGVDSANVWTPNATTPGRMQYTGAVTKVFHIIANFSIYTASGGAPSTIHLKIRHDTGVPTVITGAEVMRYLSGSVDTGSVTVQGMIALSTNSVIDIEISSSSNTPTYGIEHGQICIIPVF